MELKYHDEKIQSYANSSELLTNIWSTASMRADEPPNIECQAVGDARF